MTEVRPERTPIATLICFFEAAIAVWTIVGRTVFHIIRTTGSARAYHSYPTSLLQTVVRDLDVLLALAAAITLWQMRRSAFYLLATRFVLSLVWFVWNLLRGASLTVLQDGARSAIIHFLRTFIGLCFLMLSAAITWYVYNITKPKPETTSNPEPNSQTENLSEAPNNAQSIAKFYLTSEEDQRKPQ